MGITRFGDRRRRQAATLACALALLADPALAQPAPPSGLIPPGGTPIPQLAPATLPAVGPGLATPPAAAPAQGVAGAVPIRAVAIEGATAFAEDRIRAEAGPLTGPAVPVQAIENARAAIVSLYRGAGYAFVTADAVVGADGTLRLRVAEGTVTEVRLDGDIGPAGTQVLRFLNRLVNGRPLDVASLERQLLLAGDVPGVTVRGVLRPTGTAPGALTLVAQVSRAAISGYVTADNRGPRYAGPEQGLAAVQFNSFTELGERTELAFFIARDATQLFGQASTEFFVGGDGLRVRLYAGRGRAEPSGVLERLGYEGDTTTAGLSVSYPLIRRRQGTLNLSGAFDVLETEIRLDDAAGRSQRFSRDSLRVVRLGAEWTTYDLLLGEDRPASNLVTVRLSQGLDAFGADANGATPGRAGADTAFTKIAAEATRTQALFSPWDGALLSLQGTIAGQWTNDVLPLAEKFYLGGNRLGRGFYVGEVTGDRALAGSLELQLSQRFETAALGVPLRLEPTLYAFYDAGRTWENLSSDPDRRLQSYGLGLRTTINDRFEALVEGVHRVTRRPGGANVPAQDANAVFWRVLARF
ncbi:ShlB/FhaC/HecB family hemolysin secretion/activation protein [Roseomonas sp. CCTCC AB2023176]|uniref:ShlB/FhaC/HecB family hemolysin secretion/activation protein n=1 Tax=Roseomonas sp. CCTCC AB2023176 TaxID=3342640 RepID=UPI0035D6CA18